MNTIRFVKLLIASFVITVVCLMVIYPPPKSISLYNTSSELNVDTEEPPDYGDESVKSRYDEKVATTMEKQSKFKKKKFMTLEKNIPIYSKNVESATSKNSPTCGYEICPRSKPGMINVHLVPHTHDDVGWLNTLEQYYTGSMKSDPKISVAKIIDTVVDELQLDPSRRFIYAEMAFFQKWWKDQNEERRDVVRNLVANGRLEFVNGGWCMNDEATTHYVDIIDQMSLGLNFLNDTFGACGRPRIAWQIDPFGHSKEHASIMAQMGFDGMFLSRIHVQDKEQRANSKNLELVWQGNQNLGDDGKLFTGVLFNHYAAPKGFCFDKLSYCNAKSIDESDVENRVKDFLHFCQKQADSYKTNNIIVTMGHDFTYQNASTWFTPMDKLIKHANKLQETGSKFNLFYSTLSCYAKALHDYDTTWPSKTDDFFPIASTPVEYWTGYYTSRPALKYMVRQGSNLLQSCKQMASFLSMKSHELIGDISLMKEAMAVLQHHDAVTGTEKQHVANDYARLLHMGVEECHKIQNSFYQNNLPRKTESLPEVSYCQLNLTQCDVTEKTDRFVVNVYNSLANNIDKYVRVPVVQQDNSNYQVLDPNGEVIPSELVPIAEFVKSLPGRKSSATHELVFLASKLPPLGSKSYYVEPVEAKGENLEIKEDTTTEMISTLLMHTLNDQKFIENERITVRLNEETGLIQSVSIDGEETELKQEFFWYAGNNRGNVLPPNNDEGSAKASGAYLFRPNQSDPFPVRNNEGVATTIYKGELVQEIHQSYKDWAFQTIRLYKGQDHVELDWIVGPIPVEDGVGKEVVSRFTTKLGSKKEFYTDANGRQILKRKTNIRETYKCNVTLDPVAGNYYPINAQISIKDEEKNKQLTILVDRAQGGSSLREGQLELMLHRRLLHDDDFGVQEPLNEVAHGVGLAVRGTHFLLLGGIDESAKSVRSLNQQIYKQPQVSFISTDLSFQEWADSFNTEINTLKKVLPENVNLLTLDKRTDGKYLLRLEHIYGEGEDVDLSKPVTVNLKSLFKGFTVESVQETMLGGNQLKDESKRLLWKEANETKQEILFPTDSVIDLEKVLLNPMQIRSFILSLN